MKSRTLLCSLALLALPAMARAEICNLKVVTDASPDYSDLPSMVHSITSKWQTPEQKCWAVFYWNHIARRQTMPMTLHGMALGDPIRQFNDYGYTMCSTIAGINQGIWEAMGLQHRYWDISLHTVPEVFYDGRWHMYDSSMSALFTLCDGKTLAGVEDIGKEGGCEASGGKVEPGHIAKYHCLYATSAKGFLTGADTIRALDEEFRCFNPRGLKLRTYYYDWDFGHRYILNLKEGETYTRTYHSLGDSPGYFVPNSNGKDPESANKRYRIRGNGEWIFRPPLPGRRKAGERIILPVRADGVSTETSLSSWQSAAYSSINIAASFDGLHADNRTERGGITYRIQSANVITAQHIEVAFSRQGEGDQVRILVSTTNGLTWKEIWSSQAEASGPALSAVAKGIVDEVNGAYETLVSIQLTGRSVLHDVEIITHTALNSKTQPKLNLGRNTVYVGTGEQTESIVLWPELQANKYKEQIVEEKNIKCLDKHMGWMGVLCSSVAKEDAYIVYRIDAPNDISKLTYGGRFYNRAPKSHIGIQYSLDNGQTWTGQWSLTETKQPWDVIHYETAAIPAGHRTVLVKYLMNSPEPAVGACSIYAVRMEANYAPADASFKPIEVTFKWKEPQKDRSVVDRSHTQLVEKLPFKYTIDTAGEDQPIVDSLAINLKGARGEVTYGYTPPAPSAAASAAPPTKFISKWVTYGKNLAVGKKYTLSHPSLTNWGAGDPEGTKLTDGIVGPPYAGGTSYRSGVIWQGKTNPTISLDLGETKQCASFGLDAHGYPWWDALKGQVTDKVEVLVSEDGQKYDSLGYVNTDIRWKDFPANYMWPDDESLTGCTFRVIPPQPVKARYVQYKINSGRLFCVTELEVLDSIRYEPFDLRIALPDEK